MAFKNPFSEAENYRSLVMRDNSRQIRRFYEEAYLDTQIAIASIDKDDTTTDRVYLNRLKDELKVRIDSIDARVSGLVKDGVTTTTEKMMQSNKIFLNDLGFHNYRVNPQIVTRMVDRVITGKLYENKWSLSSAIWGNNQRIHQDINRIVSRGILQGKSTYDIARQLEKYVNPNVVRPVMSGVYGQIDYNAQRLAKTMVQHAYQQAFVEATIDNPFVEAYQWITSGAPNVCALCIEREESDEYGLGAGIYPKDALPLDHPNGQCTFDIVTTWTEETANRAVLEWALGDLDDEELSEKLDKFAENF